MSGSKSSWLTSFVDLTGLILAYFVLTFSMSDFDQRELTDIAAGFLQKTIGDQLSEDRQTVHALGSLSEDEDHDSSSRQMFARLRHISQPSEGIDVLEMDDWISVRFDAVRVDRQAASFIAVNADFLRMLSVLRVHATDVDVLARNPLAAREAWDHLRKQATWISEVPVSGFRATPAARNDQLIFLIR